MSCMLFPTQGLQQVLSDKHLILVSEIRESPEPGRARLGAPQQETLARLPGMVPVHTPSPLGGGPEAGHLNSAMLSLDQWDVFSTAGRGSRSR